MFNPEFYNQNQAVRIDPRTGAIVPGSGDRFNGVVLPGDGFPADASGQIEAAGNPEFERLFRGVPRGFSETHSTVFEPRLGMAYRSTRRRRCASARASITRASSSTTPPCSAATLPSSSRWA
jgi:hypothetical protein